MNNVKNRDRRRAFATLAQTLATLAVKKINRKARHGDATSAKKNEQLRMKNE